MFRITYSIQHCPKHTYQLVLANDLERDFIFFGLKQHVPFQIRKKKKDNMCGSLNEKSTNLMTIYE